jgi:hypothetical protein
MPLPKDRLPPEPSFYSKVAGFILFAGGVTLLAAGGWVCWQSWRWIVSAQWPQVSVLMVLQLWGIPELRSPLLGLNEIADWFLDLPASLVIFCIGALVSMYGVSALEREHQDLQSRTLEWQARQRLDNAEG